MINNRQNGRRRGRGGGSGAPRPNGSNGGQDRGNRIDSRARGNAAQLLEKYKALARDAQLQGDRVNTEYYLQFADHYFRVLSESRSRFEEQQQSRPRRDEFTTQPDEEYGDEGERITLERAPQPQHQSARPQVEAREPASGADRDEGAAHRPAEAPSPVGEQAGQEGEERRSRRGRPRRNPEPADEAPVAEVAPVESDAAASLSVSAEAEPAPVRRRGRPPKAKPAEPAPEQLELDRLPPSLTVKSAEAAEDEDAPARPRRTRKPRGESAAA